MIDLQEEPEVESRDNIISSVFIFNYPVGFYLRHTFLRSFLTDVLRSE